jgi:hypothetical protein
MPCLTYGCEVWNTTQQQMAKLEGIQYRHLRSIIGKTWRDKISHVELLQLAQIRNNKNFEWAKPPEGKTSRSLKSVETTIRLTRLRYAGHVMRMEDYRLPKLLLHAEVTSGKRATGRPMKCYRECLKDDLKQFHFWQEVQDLGLLSLTSDRDKWRSKINAAAETFQHKWEAIRTEKSNNRKTTQAQNIVCIEI